MGQLGEKIQAVLKLDSTAQAIEFQKQIVSWGQMDGAVEALSAAFEKLEIGVGAQVGSVLRNSPVHLALLLVNVTKNRCITTFNPFQPDDKIAADIERIRPPVVVASTEDWARPALRAVVEKIGAAGIELTASWSNPVRIIEGLDAVRGKDLAPALPDTAIMMLTSGTTGVPKRIPLLTDGLERAIFDALKYERDRAPDSPPALSDITLIQFTSFVHIGGIFNALRAVLCGRRLYLQSKFEVREWAAAVERYRPAVASLPPAALRMVIDADIQPEQLKSLKAVRSSTAPLNQADADEFERRYGAPVLQNYGATEFAGGVAGWTLRDYRNHGNQKRGSVGRMHDDVEGRIRDQATDAILPPGQEGILELRGPQFPDPEAWVRTTDRAVLDEDRFLWIKGRSDNAIIRGGFKVHPDEVVAAFEEHPGVREAVVVGMADTRLGAVPVAAIILKANCGNVSAEELRQWARSRLTPYQVPTAIHIVNDVPRTAALKPNLPAVREMLETMHATADGENAVTAKI